MSSPVASLLLIVRRFKLSVFNHHQYPQISIEEVRDKGRQDCITMNPDFLFKLFRQRPLPAQLQVFLLSVQKRRGVRVSYWGRVEFPLSDIVTNARRARNKRLRERTRAREPRSFVRPLLSSACCATQSTAF